MLEHGLGGILCCLGIGKVDDAHNDLLVVLRFDSHNAEVLKELREVKSNSTPSRILDSEESIVCGQKVGFDSLNIKRKSYVATFSTSSCDDYDVSKEGYPMGCVDEKPTPAFAEQMNVNLLKKRVNEDPIKEVDRKGKWLCTEGENVMVGS